MQSKYFIYGIVAIIVVAIIAVIIVKRRQATAISGSENATDSNKDTISILPTTGGKWDIGTNTGKR